MDDVKIVESGIKTTDSLNNKIKNKESNEILDLKNMVKDLRDVDIYEGIQKLLKFTTTGDYSLISEAYHKSGIDYISNKVIELLKPFTDNILVEYSLISSTLDPKDPDKLQCCAFVVGSDSFRECVNDFYTQCIDYTEKRCNISIYQHPHFLYDIPQIGEIEEFKNDTIFTVDGKPVDDNTSTVVVVNGRGLTVSTKCSEKGSEDTFTTDNYLICEGKGGDFKSYNEKNINIEAFSLPRHFKDMLLEAKKIASEKIDNGYRLIDIQNCLHSFCHRNITCNHKRTDDNNNIDQISSVYVSFPVYGSIASNQLPIYKISNNALQGIGACFIYFEPKDYSILQDEESKDYLRYVISLISDIVGFAIRFVSANYMFNLGLQLQENARKEAMKSAKAAIMSRNMSHNLGSHVMSYLKQNLSSVQSMLNDRILALLFENEQDMLNKLEVEFRKELLPDKKDSLSEKAALPFLVGLGQFISYIQERQDFIATIATDYIPYLSNINFKDFIYDELNPDKRYERHKDRKNLEIDNILLGNIARSEGLGRETSPTRKKESRLNDIVLKFRSFDGNAVLDADGNILHDKDSAYYDLKDMRDYEFSLPGGVVGRQAIFSIVENVIRNAAKHGNWREKKKLELTFDIYKKDDFAFNEKGEIIDMFGNNRTLSSLFDNPNHLNLKEVFENVYLKAKDSNDLYFVTLTDNLSFDEAKLGKLRKSIIEPLVDDKGIMNEASKGIKEMRISASWLRGIGEADVYNPVPTEKDANIVNDKVFANNKHKKSAPILYARMSNGHLQYIFCILRPKKVAIVSTRFKDKAFEYNKKAFLRFSWGAFTPVQFNYLNNKSYDFVIFDNINKSQSDVVDLDGNKENYDSYDYLRRISSSRLLKLSDITELKDCLFAEIAKVFNSLDEEALFYKNIESILYKHISSYKENKDYIVIDDKKTNSRKENEGLIPFEAIKILDGINQKQPTDQNWYIYRTHHESTEEFGRYMTNMMGSKVKNGCFVEGITGNNSTDRLTRNDSLDKEWFYRHLHAMKEKIGVFDERIFTKIYGLEESDLKQLDSNGDHVVDLTTFINRYFEDNNIKSFKEKKEFRNSANLVQILDSQYHFLGTSSAKSINEKDSKTYFTPTANTQKGIFVFTIIQDPEKENSSKFNLYGIKRIDTPADSFKIDDIDDMSIIDGRYYSKCVKLATIEWKEGTSEQIDSAIHNCHLDVNWLNNADVFFANKFDHISIHQGILDKLYEGFGIKDNPDKKEILTRDFYKKFSRKKDDIIEYGKGNNKFFLPGMCIHSGRSKPSKVDMPQELPFIQYASIEHAILDCKYSLVELLDFARYE